MKKVMGRWIFNRNWQLREVVRIFPLCLFDTPTIDLAALHSMLKVPALEKLRRPFKPVPPIQRTLHSREEDPPHLSVLDLARGWKSRSRSALRFGSHRESVDPMILKMVVDLCPSNCVNYFQKNLIAERPHQVQPSIKPNLFSNLPGKRNKGTKEHCAASKY